MSSAQLDLLSAIVFGGGNTPSEKKERDACKKMMEKGLLKLCGPMPLDGYCSYGITDKGREALRKNGYRGSVTD